MGCTSQLLNNGALHALLTNDDIALIMLFLHSVASKSFSESANHRQAET